ncbi:hypothetical protein GWI33_017920 [Rhynchophorus ferrugineus]|uniref:MI domain-containing protein n=1 Tax=Rhynchophorus ferrugineus TaxID=354439 RepID=A0A834HUG7_RHYFE|nr:hypothetical protein GWI33_017920 [Rhynchophorus ferrugineus]
MGSDSENKFRENRSSRSPENDSKERSKKHESKSSKSRRRRSRSRSSSQDRKKRDTKKRKSDGDSPIILPRYYGDDRRKENNDRYWTKYPKRDDNVIGKRYYDDEDDDYDKRDRNERRSKRSKEDEEDKVTVKPRERKAVDLITSKTGGAYIPPAKLRMMQAEITDKTSAAFQRIAWEALKKSLHGYINKVNTSNIGIIARELLHENIIRGRGLLCKSIIQAQAASPTFTNVYAALVSVINSKFPNIGELLLKSYFYSSFEVAIAFLKECGQKLSEVSSRGITAIFEMLRNILHEGKLEKRIQYMIEVMFQIRKDGFKDHAAVIEELDIVEEDDQFTHLIKLDDVNQSDADDILNVFKFDDDYEVNEGKYKILSKEILQTDSESGSSDGESGEEDDSDDEDDDDDDDDDEEATKSKDTIIDNTETNLIVLRRTIYLTIQSSLDFEECAHKLLKMELKPGQEIELCHMFLDCCAEQRTYEKFYGLLAQRFCQINKQYVEPFQQIFKDTYATTHRLDANRLRNVSKFFAHLLFTDAIGWEVLEIMKMNEEDTNSSSRIFIKILFQELAEYMGLAKLNERLKDPTLQGHFAGLFPRDSPKNTRFSINFFTSIGLGGLTDELREHLKNIPKNVPVVPKEENSPDESSSSNSSSSDSSSSEDSSSESSSDSDDAKKKKKKRKEKIPKSPKEEESSRKSKNNNDDKNHKRQERNHQSRRRSRSEERGRNKDRRDRRDNNREGRRRR